VSLVMVHRLTSNCTGFSLQSKVQMHNWPPGVLRLKQTYAESKVKPVSRFRIPVGTFFLTIAFMVGGHTRDGNKQRFSRRYYAPVVHAQSQIRQLPHLSSTSLPLKTRHLQQ